MTTTFQKQFEKDYPNKDIKELNLSENKLTSVDFLKQVPNPNKLEWLNIHSNNIIELSGVRFLHKKITIDLGGKRGVANSTSVSK